MKKFCESLRDDAMEVINFKKKIMKLLTNKQKNEMKMEKLVIIVKKYLRIIMLKIKSIIKIGTIVIIQVNIEVMHIVYVI